MNKVFKLYVMPGGTKAPETFQSTRLWLPTTPYGLLDIWDRLGLSADEPVWLNITDTAIPNFPQLPLENEANCFLDDLYALDLLAQKLSEFDKADRLAFAGLLRREEAQRKNALNVPRLIELVCGIDRCHVLPAVTTDGQLGEFVVEYGLDAELEELPDEALDWLHSKGLLNYPELGRRHRLAENGVYVRDEDCGICGYVEQYMELPEMDRQPDLHMERSDYAVLLRMSDGREMKLPTEEPLPDGSFTCLDCRIPAIAEMIGQEQEPDAVNRFAQTLDKLTPREILVCKAVIEAAACSTLEQVTDVIRHVDEYILAPDQRTPADWVQGMLPVMLNGREKKELAPLVRLQRCGEALMRRMHCAATAYGVVKRGDGQPLTQPAEEPEEMAGMEGMR